MKIFHEKKPHAIIHHGETILKIHLFIKKSDDEGKDFNYMSRTTSYDWLETTIRITNTTTCQLSISNMNSIIKLKTNSTLILPMINIIY
ncbi:DUF3427 domain-containing protein [Methanobrevibacter sp.]